MKLSNEKLSEQVTKLTTSNETLLAENKLLKKDTKEHGEAILDIKCRQMRNNLVIEGVKEEKGETWAQTEKKVFNFLKHDMEIPDDVLQKINFQRTHRFGKKDLAKGRPIVAMFSHSKGKDEVLSRGFKLKGKPYSVYQQYPREIAERRKVLVPILKRHKKDGGAASLSVDRLYIEGKLNSPTRRWFHGCK